jgi:hypothetical protein
MATATARTDIHRPSSASFDPAAYRVAAVYDNADHWSNLARLDDVARLSGDGYRLGAGDHAKCGHCGTHIRYSALLVRDDAKEFIHVGEQCLDNRFRSLTAAEFKRLRETARLNRERANAEERIDALVEKHPILQRLLNNGDDVKANTFLVDVRRKFFENGRLTDRQIAAVEGAFNRDEQRKQWAREKSERQEKWAAEKAALRAAGVEAPEGRVEVEGEIVSVKWHETPIGYGRRVAGCHKIVVKTDAGWSCWATLPSELSSEADSAKGRRIKFTATLTRSDRDSTFAFGKRPTGAAFLNS